MSVQIGYQTLIGHAGVITIAASAIDATIESMEAEVSWTETEIKNGAGTTTGFDGRDQRLTVNLTFRPTDASTTPTLKEAPAPGTEVTLSGFLCPGTQVGEADVNGVFSYLSGWSTKWAGGQIIECSCNLLQTSAIPT